jgi:hypothetical protein
MFDYEYDRTQIIRDLGIEESAPEFKAHILTRIEQLLDEGMLSRVEAALTDEQAEEFNKLESREAAQDFVRQCLPNIDDMYKEQIDSIVGDLKTVLEA